MGDLMTESDSKQKRIYSAEKLRNELINLCLIVISFLSIPALAGSLSRISDIGLQSIMYLHVILVLAIIGVTLNRKRLSYLARSTFLTGVFFIVGLAGTIKFGVSGNGIPFLLGTAIFATIFINRNAGIIWMSISMLSFVTVAILHQLEILTFTIDFNDYNRSVTAWIAFGSSTLLLGFILVIVLGRFNRFFFQLVENLEQLVMERTQELKRANQTKSEFLANMSHEIRTPMNGVLGMLRLLEKSELNESQRHKTHLAKSSAESLLSLINDILDFSKVEAGKMELERTDFNLLTLIGEVAEACAMKIQKKGVELVLDLTEVNTTLVNGDPGKIRQILTNLIGNAVKFTHNGEVIVHASLNQKESENQVLLCQVSDTGIGIPAEKVAKLFTAFTQGDASTTREYGGTGLGLSICEKLCRLMGGSIQVKSLEGKGSSFEFQIPLQTSDKAAPLVPENHLEQMRILVLDDNEQSREAIVKQFTHWGANCVAVASVDDAIARCRDNAEKSPDKQFNGALVDMHLAHEDFMNFVREIQNDQTLRKIQLVVMTDFSDIDEPEKFERQGIAGYFPKPVTTYDLLKAAVCMNGELNAINSLKFTQDNLKNLPVYEMNEAIDENKILRLKRLAPHILIVEDNYVNQQVVLGILEEFGVTADVVENGLQAIHRLRKYAADNPYELVLMDCQTPEMDGYQASKLIRSGDTGESNRTINIIAMTANAMEGDKQKCLAAGMDDYIRKPVEPERLLNALDRWVGNRRSPEQSALPAAHENPGLPTDKPKIHADWQKKQTQETVWDYAGASKRTLGKRALLKKAVGIFLRDVDSYCLQIKDAIDAGDLEGLSYHAHTLKGSAGNIGGAKLQSLASQLEKAAIARETGLLATLYLAVEAAKEQLVSQLDNFMEQQ